MISPSYVSGFGFYVPDHIVSNADFTESAADITNEWIISRTGIESRRIVAPGQTGTDMALFASLSAIEKSGRTADDISHIIYATCTPDAACPAAACTLEAKLGINGRMAVDINAACAGFLNGLELARALVALSPSACVLLAASESLSHRCNREDPSTAVLLGDGAGAVLLTGSETPPPVSPKDRPQGRIVDAIIGSDGGKGKLLLITGGFSASPYALGDTVGPDYFIRMDGGLVFKHAVRNMTASCQAVLARNGLTPDDVDVFVPHQANLRIIEAVGNRLGIPAERCFLNVQKYGNTSAASIPIALGEALDAGAIRRGMNVLCTSFGGGLTWGATLLQF